MSTQHTPGPWFAGYGEGLTGPTTPSFAGPCCGGKNWGYEPVRCGDRTIAICPNQEAAALRISDIKGSAAANARLIAAAPDMLAALQATLQDLRVRGELCDDGVLELNISNGILCQLESAIMKATGKEPA